MADPGCLYRIAVGEIGWSQDSIAGVFRDGHNVHQDIAALRQETLEQILFSIRRYPPIRVVRFVDQGWITLDNRRLYLFRSVLRPETIIEVRIATLAEAEELKWKLTTRDEGRSTLVRPF